MRMPADPILPPELAYDDAPPLTDADLERWEAAVLFLADEAAMDVDAAACTLLDAADRPHVLDPGDEAELAALPDAAQPLIFVDHVQTTQQPRWRIEDDEAAEWAMRVVARIDADLADLAEKADGWQQRIQHWFRQASRPLHARRALMEHCLKDYARRERERDPKRKTVKLPAGQVSSRAAQPQAKVVDEAQVIAWARANLAEDAAAEVVKVVESVLVSKLREHVTVGQIIDSVAWEAELACGHVEEGYSLARRTWVPVEGDEGDGGQAVDVLDPALPEVAEVLTCDVCALDPDAATGQAVARVLVVTEHRRLVVLDPDGMPVPGALAEPGDTTYTVKAAQ